jgi:hypothetical protein
MTGSGPARPGPLLVFSDDWGRHPSSSQHLVSRMLGAREVVWVNTIGTRPPRLDIATVRRVGEKLRQWRRPGEVAPRPGLAPGAPRVLAPRMWPSFSNRLYRALNRRLLAAALGPELALLPAAPTVLTTIPLVADLVGVLRARRWVYYCVDDFGTWPGYDGRTLAAMERELVPRMDAVVCVSDALADRMRALGARPTVLTHGVDSAAWRTAGASPAVPPELAGLEAPYVVFWGVVDRRMDLSWVSALSDRMARGTIVFIGPVEDPDPALMRLPRVAARPPVPPARLPAIAAHAAVLVMPYSDQPATRAMQPLKLKEYLASGRPTVVRALPATEPWADACDVCRDAEAFAAKVLERLDGPLPASQSEARRRLDAESWEGKAASLSHWIDGDAAPATRAQGEAMPCHV